MQDLARSVTRTVVASTLNVARYPIDVATHLIPDGQDGPRRKVTALIDRADGTLRQTLGELLGDSLLEADGRRRIIAARERLQAARLRSEATATRTQADDEAVRRIEAAEEHRAAVRQAADDRQAEASRLREERLTAQRRAADARKSEVADRETAVQASVDQAAKRARLQALDEKAEALDGQSDALVATDEANRLANAASKAKAARKAR